MEQEFARTITSTRWTEDAAFGGQDPPFGRALDFQQRKKWIDLVIKELKDNLKLFFSVLIGVQNLRSRQQQAELWGEITELLKLDANDMVEGLKRIYQKRKLSTYEIPEKYDHILQAVRNLGDKLPIEKELLLPFKRQSHSEDKLEWITAILANRARMRNLKKRIHLMHAAIEETNLENFALTDRSRREVGEIIEESELKLTDAKLADDVAFAQLQKQSAKKNLDLDQNNEYRDLCDEHNQKRRKITKLTVQLQLWMKKYDKFVGEPMKEIKVLEDEVDQFMEWTETVYEPEMEKYNQLKVSVEMFEMERFEEQVEMFKKEHAARVIQRAWRAAQEKRKSKKSKKKKGKKGTKGKSKK
ncbi:dynein regulatory complex protein 10-like [Armigeres subalbatus]|uniref:dynein regulatory complex protein 10-like n=1 Tax=Armigeres subalbatus TaxID=124917 RepID=UPI002ED476B7